MLNSLISGALKNRFMVLAITIIVSIVGAVSALRLPLDAVPDLTNIQVQVITEAAALTTQFDPCDVKDLATLRPQLRADDLDDIPDPIGKKPEVYAGVAEQIAALVAPIFEFCRRVAAEG